jgi:DNA-binding transcriptional ArsR family regulator
MIGTADVPDVESVSSDGRARTLLEHPLRPAILRQASEPASATEIARRLGETRQKINYHVRRLADEEFLVEAGTRPRRGLTERLYRASARRYVLDPAVIPHLGASPRDVTDPASAAHLVALAARTQSEVARAAEQARSQGTRLATLSLDADLHFQSAEQRAAFTRALHQAVLEVVAGHTGSEARESCHEPGVADSSRGRPYRLVVGCHPVPEGPTADDSDPPLPPSPHEEDRP